MRIEENFSAVECNSATKHLRRQVNMRLDEVTIRYFKTLAQETGIPYQSLINLYLRDCVASGCKPITQWQPAA